MGAVLRFAVTGSREAQGHPELFILCSLFCAGTSAALAGLLSYTARAAKHKGLK